MKNLFYKTQFKYKLMMKICIYIARALNWIVSQHHCDSTNEVIEQQIFYYFYSFTHPNKIHFNLI